MDIDDNMDLDAAVPSESRYLKKEDVGTEGKVFTIKGLKRENIAADGQPEDTQTLLYFHEADKPMVLKPTNKQLLKLALTGDPKAPLTAGEIKGKKILVYNDPTVSFGPEIVGGIRLGKAPDAAEGIPF